ncbi:UNVERIFIED_CONTAM: hypothetical protein H355_010047, partial [Colinus virginianus]
GSQKITGQPGPEGESRASFYHYSCLPLHAEAWIRHWGERLLDEKQQPYTALSCCNGAAKLENTFKLTDTAEAKFSMGDFEAIKICDVGVSLPLDENMTVSDPTVHYIGTEPWKPKEALSDDGVITDKADIFSFGLTLWEMMTLSVPHLNLDSNADEDTSFDEDDFDEEAYYAALGTRPALNMDELDSSYQQVIELFSICTSEDPKKRPSAAHVVAVLEASLPPELVA